GGGAAPIQHYASPPEIGPKLIFVATEGGRGGRGGTTFTVSASGSAPVQPAGAAAGGFGRGGARIDATHTLVTRTSNNGLTRTTESGAANGGPPVTRHGDHAAQFV